MKRRRQIDRQRFVPVFGRKRFDRRKVPDHRVVDQDIDRLKAAEQFSHHGSMSALRQVRRNAYHLDRKARPKTIPCFCRLDQIVQDNVGSRAGKAFGHGQAQACRCPGHESPFALQHRLRPRLFPFQLGKHGNRPSLAGGFG